MDENRAGKIWLLASLAVCAIACASKSGLQSGVAGNKALKDLSQKEIQKICDAADAFIAAALPSDLQARAQCARQALASGNVVACDTALQACLDQLEGGGKDGGMASFLPSFLPQIPRQGATTKLQCFTTTELDACKATVSELESCVQGHYAAQSRELSAASCDELNPGHVSLVAPQGKDACETLDTKCPGISNFTQRTTTPGQTPPPTTTPPPNLSVSCSDLNLSYDGSDCSRTACTTPVSCTCNSVPMTYSTSCNTVKGCLRSVDCKVACTTLSSRVSSCASDNSCKSDSDCGDNYCVMSSGSTSGSCSRGKPGDSCTESGDCMSGACASDPRTSTMRCMGDSSTGTTCSMDVECASGICLRNASLGTSACSDGMNGDACQDSTDCKSGSCVYVGLTSGAASSSQCTDRMTGSPCSSDSDCVSTHCASNASSTPPSSLCVDGKPGDPCDSSSDCTSGRCVTSQTTRKMTCGYAAGATCSSGAITDGKADCNGECRAAQASCSGSSCVALCGGGSCSSAMLATFSMTDKSTSITLSNGNLTATATSSEVAVRATVGKTSGKWYWEVTAGSASSGLTSIGVLSMTAQLDFGLGNGAAPGAGYSPSGTLSATSSSGTAACAFSSGTVIGIALDLDLRVVYFSQSGVWQGGADPVSGSGGLSLGSSNEAFYPAVSLGYGDVLTANFGQSSFAHGVPAGYEAVAQ